MATKASLLAQAVKNPPSMWETGFNQEDPLKKGKATHSSVLAWRISWTEEPGRLQSMGSHRVGHDWTTNTFTFILRFKCEMLGTLERDVSKLTEGLCLKFLIDYMWGSVFSFWNHWRSLVQVLNLSFLEVYIQDKQAPKSFSACLVRLEFEMFCSVCTECEASDLKYFFHRIEPEVLGSGFRI